MHLDYNEDARPFGRGNAGVIPDDIVAIRLDVPGPVSLVSPNIVFPGNMAYSSNAGECNCLVQGIDPRLRKRLSGIHQPGANQ